MDTKSVQATVLSHFAIRLAVILKAAMENATANIANRLVVTLIDAIAFHLGKTLDDEKASVRITDNYASCRNDVHAFYGKPDVGSAANLSAIISGMAGMGSIPPAPGTAASNPTAATVTTPPTFGGF
eukprot:227967-Amphidinium_carterae.1